MGLPQFTSACALFTNVSSNIFSDADRNADVFYEWLIDKAARSVGEPLDSDTMRSLADFTITSIGQKTDKAFDQAFMIQCSTVHMCAEWLRSFMISQNIDQGFLAGTSQICHFSMCK